MRYRKLEEFSCPVKHERCYKGNSCRVECKHICLTLGGLFDVKVGFMFKANMLPVSRGGKVL